MAEKAPSDLAWQRLYAAIRETRDYQAFQALAREHRCLAESTPRPAAPASARIALLSSATTSKLDTPLRLTLEALGVATTMHVPDFNTSAREMLDPSSGTVAFGPNVAVVLNTPANLGTWPRWNATEVEARQAADEVCDHWLGLCKSLHDLTGCDVVLGNFHQLPERPLSAAGVKMPGDARRFLRRVNDQLAERAPEFVHILDVESLAAVHGIDRWFDYRFWYHAKLPVSFECLVPLVRGIAETVSGLLGRAAKCVVLDLDGTLWGGTVGDDGPERVVLGDGDARGEAFVAFQRYLASLQQRGLMLAVVSKNDEAAALAPFATRREMVLRRSDFAAFIANWQPKSENLCAVATELNIGLDALVFVDDNPVERDEVRQAVPEVRVVELGDDPAEYPLALDRCGWLGTVAVSAEDAGRPALVAAEGLRRERRSGATSYPEFLRSLEQRATIGAFEERQLDRIAQLTNKTNQFNLTTRRLTRSELAAMAASPGHVTASVRLADRFGDNGLISMLAARADGQELWIDLWLMSCRVFNRGVEQLLCNHLVDRANAEGYRQVHGVYRPTAKNILVKGHYPAMGFAAAGPVEGGEHWVLEPASYRPFETSIQLVDDY